MRQRMPCLVVQVAMRLRSQPSIRSFTSAQGSLCTQGRQEGLEGGKLMSRMEAGAPCAPGPEFWASPALGTKVHPRLSSLMSLGFVCLLLACCLLVGCFNSGRWRQPG